jgi:hypothetical protein
VFDLVAQRSYFNAAACGAGLKVVVAITVKRILVDRGLLFLAGNAATIPGQRPTVRKTLTVATTDH